MVTRARCGNRSRLVTLRWLLLLWRRLLLLRLLLLRLRRLVRWIRIRVRTLLWTIRSRGLLLLVLLRIPARIRTRLWVWIIPSRWLLLLLLLLRVSMLRLPLLVPIRWPLLLGIQIRGLAIVQLASRLLIRTRPRRSPVATISRLLLVEQSRIPPVGLTPRGTGSRLVLLLERGWWT